MSGNIALNILFVSLLSVSTRATILGKDNCLGLVLVKEALPGGTSAVTLPSPVALPSHRTRKGFKSTSQDSLEETGVDGRGACT